MKRSSGTTDPEERLLSSSDEPTLPEGGEDEPGSGGTEPPTLAPGDVLLDDYVVESHLGRGGMGSVYLVRSRSTRKAFAVKRVLPELVRSPRHRRSFLRELQTWGDLPESPYLTAFRFFRRLGEEILIFAEYVEGSSLAEAVRDGRVSDLMTILDVAVQTAWGLTVAHSLGVVHQDVKPGNVLLGTDGTAKLTDFGLARAAGDRSPEPAEMETIVPDRTILVSWGGSTPAYCSPEQADRQALTHRTDVWSWGLTVLEMFTGGVSWYSGRLAAGALEANLAQEDPSEGGLAIPPALVELLRGCFRSDPEERWGDMEQVAERLVRIYQDELGRPYPRSAPVLEESSPVVTPLDRRSVFGGFWDDPRLWLEKVLQAAGREPAEAGEMILPARGSRRAGLIADLAAFEEARRLLEGLVEEGRSELRGSLAKLCRQMAGVHGELDDLPGGIALGDRAIALWEEILAEEWQDELAEELAGTSSSQGVLRLRLARFREAAEDVDRAIQIYERMIREGRETVRTVLARALLNRATALAFMHRTEESIQDRRRSIDLLEELVEEGRRELASDLAMAYIGTAGSLMNMGELEESLERHRQGITILRELVEEEGRRDLAPRLATALSNHGHCLGLAGDHPAAMEEHRRAVQIARDLVECDGRRDLAYLEATFRGRLAGSHLALEEFPEALSGLERAVEILERMVQREGRGEFSFYLASLYSDQARALEGCGRPEQGAPLAAEAVRLYRLLVEEGQEQYRDSLETARLLRDRLGGRAGRESA